MYFIEPSFGRNVKNHENKVQQLIKRQVEEIKGIYLRTPIQPLISELRLVPGRILLDHRQRIYTYRLFSVSNDHSTKNVRPISFCNRDGDITQEDEQQRDILA